MIACQVKQMSKEVSSFFSADDVAKIRKFSQSSSKVNHLKHVSVLLKKKHLTHQKRNSFQFGKKDPTELDRKLNENK